jgi:hypothetical protein
MKFIKINRDNYPVLSKMAKDYLAVQASSTACERTFSEGRHAIPYNRGRLKAEGLEYVLCLKSWISHFN